jgi:hypothetical protein
LERNVVVGPGSYTPFPSNIQKAAPNYSMGSHLNNNPNLVTPAPGDYKIPTRIGEESPSRSFGSKLKGLIYPNTNVPGPG